MNKPCPICSHAMSPSFNEKVLTKYDVTYLYCSECHFLQTEEPYWLDEAYSSAINDTDVGYVGRNLLMSRITLILFFFLFNKKDAFLDYAGGYGLFTRLMHDYGLRFFWMDKHSQGLFVQGLKYTNQHIKALTCFECFEHFVDPISELKNLLTLSKTILFSTTLIPKDSLPDRKSWGYYGFSHGQHVSFYSEKSLRILAKQYGLYFYTNGDTVHMFTNKKISNLRFNSMLLLAKFRLDVIIEKILK